jgi:hypothetical protein
MERALKFAASRWVRVVGAVALLLVTRPAAAQSAPPPAPSSPPVGTAPPPSLAPSPLLDDRSSAPPPTPAATTPPPPAPTTEPPPASDSEPATPVYDEKAVQRRLGGPFSKGSVRLTLLLGTGTTVADTYFILGGGLGYFVLDGLEFGLDYEAWLFGSPVMQRLSPETRYVLYMVPTIKPYIGFFYRHTFIKNYDDFDYLGGRLGVFVAPERSRAYFGGGAVYEHMLKCKSGDYIHCDDWYPEVSIGVAF